MSTTTPEIQRDAMERVHALVETLNKAITEATNHSVIVTLDVETEYHEWAVYAGTVPRRSWITVQTSVHYSPKLQARKEAREG